MYAVVSPAKKLDFEAPANAALADLPATKPVFPGPTKDLITVARDLSRSEISGLMSLSESLADLNYERFQAFKLRGTPETQKQASLAFAGDTYIGLDANSLAPEDFDWAQENFGILSGLYGLLRPLDMIQPYRLEMGTRLKRPDGVGLYDFWGDKIAKELNKRLKDHNHQTVINLASTEYFKAVDQKALKATIITPAFKELREDGQLKMVGFFAKRARGAMARYIIDHRLTDPEGLKSFDTDGYKYQAALSSDREWVFTR